MCMFGPVWEVAGQAARRRRGRQPCVHLANAHPPSPSPLPQGVGEVPPGATLDFDVELLSIKADARGYQVKLVEG